MKALEQLLRQVDWSALDILVIDMPPGTGDTQLTITQQIPLSDSRYGSKYEFLLLPKCNHQEYIFGKDGGRTDCQNPGSRYSRRYAPSFDVVSTSDSGKPITVSQPDSIHAQNIERWPAPSLKNFAL
ncbi:hypothetical protein BASA62_005213 [Batrachochytrium salamandrivorans]|nr:hypothetical protein BASA62_005213 [Batrachochytrium salamandrivorans]